MSKFEKISPKNVQLDSRYQRDLDEKRANGMASAIVDDLLGVPVLSRRKSGTVIAIDGQHRITSLQKAGRNEPILCQVHEGLSLQEEADLFLKLNGQRVAVGKYDKFKASIVAKDPQALSIEKIVSDAGLRITRGPSGTSV